MREPTTLTRARRLHVTLVAITLLAVSCGPLSQSSAGATTTSFSDSRTAVDTSPVALYGDSIGYEISTYLKAKLSAATKRKLVARVFGGTNACDFLGTAKQDRIIYNPKYVVILFTGNAFTSCTGFVGQRPTMTQRVDMTIKGVKDLMAKFPGSHFFLVGFVRNVNVQSIYDAGFPTVPDVLNYRLGQLARATRSTYVSLTQVLYDRNGRAQMQLPCSRALDGAMCGASGVVTVRAPDGGHLCPETPPAIQGVLPSCKVPSPGANRMSDVILRSILRKIASS